MNVDSPEESARRSSPPKELVDKLLSELAALNSAPSPQVERALRTVPRHLFVPGMSLEEAYADDAIITKRDESGTAISSVSAPQAIVTMLDQLDVRPGDRVLEIGSGGYNAALLAELVGEHGSLVTIDIDPEVVDRARTCLAAAGYERVRVLCGDGELGVPGYAPYNRIIVTVGAWDIPPAWTEQLADDGRLVVPLRMRGLTRSLALERQAGHLVSRSYEMSGFVPMQGVGEFRTRVVPLLGEKVSLSLDDGEQVDADRLREALSSPRVEAWSGITLDAGGRMDCLHLWLAMSLPGFCLLMADRAAVELGIVSQAWPIGVPTIVDNGSFAYLTLRPTDSDQTRYEFGACGHGPEADKIADLLITGIQSWDGVSLNARFHVFPAGTAGENLPPGFVVDKHHTRVTVSWP